MVVQQPVDAVIEKEQDMVVVVVNLTKEYIIMKENISLKFRKYYGLSMQELANVCGKSRQAVMKWEYNNAVPASTKYLLQSILDQCLSSEQMVVKLKQVFDKPIDTKSI